MSIGWRCTATDGRSPSGEVVRPDERLSWPRTIGIGMQHVVAMFGATFLVPLLTGFSPATTLFFSAVGTVAFLLITRNRLPSYLGLLVRVHRAHRRGDRHRRAVRRARRHRSWPACCSPPSALVVHVAGLAVDRRRSCRPSSPARSSRSSASTSPRLGTCSQSVVDGDRRDVQQRLPAAPSPRSSRCSRSSCAPCCSAASSAGCRSSSASWSATRWPTCAARSTSRPSRDAAWVGLPQFLDADVRPRRARAVRPRRVRPRRRELGHVKSVAAMTGHDIDPLTGPRPARRRHRHHPRRARRRLGHHHLRREHRRHGRDQGLLDGRVLGRRGDGAACSRCRRSSVRWSPRSPPASSAAPPRCSTG